MRYDFFVAKRLNISRNKALELIENEEVLLNDKSFKASFNIKKFLVKLKQKKDLSFEEIFSSKELNLELLGKIYVSRAALKLKTFLQNNNIFIKDKICLDIGSSTGGFVQILLENKALKVVALDIGDKQLHASLRSHARLIVYENTDLREFKSEEQFDLITCDVSFISLKSLLFYIDQLALKELILLFKPQFEVGKNVKRDKKGVLKDDKAISKSRLDFEKECAKLGWILKNTQESCIKGKEGNIEYFYYYVKN
ncbi:TlyA family RNA methyltransferase [Campylobacter hepaticus]|uniref:TlyA family RNA methyltransferase n=1 Tax=Campylobacter hepaticus TaxID=1813019 RepID=A0A6A7JTG3_9BACT|nr:TlyA family RNA methyltransferase [Campylobacter hepaticus]AXP08809.1 TlyA family RNA methyltransferase [Campylobacter hepaticus]MPV53639.1 TlyA family RNA methyltransferase [Campylobacter hepaticus]MPV61722.1 TlyA family RNA methyltransferase [Campylobacter hepaticus]MPV77197.1 TlyA family RNA methyltransferase [Campylobacter hepaticus]MPV78961.1 TlyA family RNA methyltransferase [Campylobacter hepaticus]